MAVNVLLQPCGLPAQKNFDATVKSPVSRDLIISYVDDPDRRRLSELLRDFPRIATWGMINSRNTSQQKAWRDMKPGDAVVFAGLKKILASGFLVGKIESTGLGNALFAPQDDGRDFEYIYFIDDVKIHEFITWDDFRKVLDYKPRDRPHNARLLVGIKAQHVLDWLAAYRDPTFDSRTLEALSEFFDDETDDLEEEGARLYRQQQFLERSRKNRDLVLAMKGHVCEVCGYTFADQFRGFSPSAHVHHKEPLAAGKRKAQLSDFAVLCAPCHTAAHMGQGRKLKPWTVDELRGIIRRRWDNGS